MSDTAADPHCPECGGPIGQTATYCMHCSADLTEERAVADADGDGAWDRTGSTSTTRPERSGASEARSSGIAGAVAARIRDLVDEAGSDSSVGTDSSAAGGSSAGDDSSNLKGTSATNDASPGVERSDRLLSPDGLVDDTLTVVVGIVGGLIVGVVGTTVLGAITGSAWAFLFGLIAWLGATAYLVRRRTVQRAVAKSGYAVALVLLAAPLVALSPVLSVDGGIEERGGLFFVLLVFVAVPAGIAAVIGWLASRFVSADAGRDVG